MAQHDYVIANDTGANVRSDLNNALSAIVSLNAGATAPTTTYAYMLWFDTGNNVLKIRDSGDSAWYTMPISPVADNTVDINAGAIDGTTIGASTAAAATFTNLTSTGTTALQNLSSTNSAVNISSSASDGAVTIDAFGNVGIGTSSPATTLHVEGDARLVGTLALNNGTENNGFIFGNSNGLVINAGGTTDTLICQTSGIEAMRIDSSGKVGVGQVVSAGGVYTSAYLTSQAASSTSNGAVCLELYAGASTATRYLAAFSNANGVVGSISTSGSSTSYNTSSDYRLKEDWQPMTGSIDRLKALNPVNFAWKVDGSRVDGFLAHEAAEVVPEAVTGEKDAVEAIGNITDAEGTVVQENVTEPAELSEGQTWTKTEDRPVYQGIDQSKLVPLLTAALQEAVSKIEALETRIAALEAA